MVLLHGIGDSARTWDLVLPALAPAGAWAAGDPVAEEALRLTERIRSGARAAAAHADAIAATPEGRRRATSMIVSDGAGLPADLVAHMIRATAAADGFEALTAAARRDGWPLDAARVRDPVRVLWGTADRLLPWPGAAAALRRALPRAEWITLDGVGHHPQLEVPLETAELILGLSLRVPTGSR
ncbi:MAG: alpha/beta fold hydrolase [Thermoleophilia bacterium]